MDFLKAEIERKKRQIQEKNVLQPEKKYFKRGDLAALQEKEYLEKYVSKSQTEEGSDNADKNEKPESDVFVAMEREVVIEKLRETFEPILLFGESEKQANIRLCRLEENPEDVAGKQKTEEQQKEAMKIVDKQYLKSALQENKEEGGDSKYNLETKIYNTTKTYEDLLLLSNDLRKGDVQHDEMVITEFVKVLMTMWVTELNSRPEHVKMSVKGKLEASTYKQTRDYLKPLLKLLKKNQLTDDIRDSLTQMVRYLLHRDYILANERYMEMAIGNAPWPIGVTNAGIHARPGRERIFSKHVAHVLNDETQRKYIQGLKRLVSKCQQYYPTDPSRSVDFSRQRQEQSQDE